jgi:hypothetical protein
MIKLTRITAATSIAAMALVFAPISGVSSITNWIGSSTAYAGNNSGGSGDHGNSGEHANSNDNGSSEAHISSSDSGKSSHGNSDVASNRVSNSGSHHSGKTADTKEKNIVALAGAGNAAHASVQGLLHASPNSRVGRLKAYADLNFEVTSGKLQTAIDTAQTALDAAKVAFDLAYPDFDTLTDAEKVTALASAEGLAVTQAEAGLADAQQALAAAKQNASDALAQVTRNGKNPEVKAYIDGLMTKYYDYLASL